MFAGLFSRKANLPFDSVLRTAEREKVLQTRASIGAFAWNRRKSVKYPG